jgi:TfoX/Sxy family transcriptional regulator of competence genes
VRRQRGHQWTGSALDFGAVMFDEGLAQRIREHLIEGANVAEKKMFGGLAFMVDGNMCIGVIGGELIARVGPQATDTALARPGARTFDFSGRPMKGWVTVRSEVLSEDQMLATWIDDALGFVRTLPPK